MNLNYSINGISFLNPLGIIVSDSSGVIDMLTLKEPLKVNWPDAHGEVIDLDRPRYEARKIKLDCFMLASSAAALIDQLNGLKTELLKSGTQRLMLSPLAGKPFVYEVYLSEGIQLEKKWRESQMVAKFALNLIEPQPVKWVLSGAGSSSVSIRLTSPTPLTIHWGDGSKSIAQGVNQTYSHNYGGSDTAIYYAIVSGELERLTVHQIQNLTEIWPRLY